MNQLIGCYSWSHGSVQYANLFCAGGPLHKREFAPMVVLEDSAGEGGDIGSLS
jgi:hypothetical protein